MATSGEYAAAGAPISPDNPTVVLFAQHGWADTSRAIAELAQNVATPGTHLVTPNLGYIRTWLRIGPLIEYVEEMARATLAQFPGVPLRIIGHSMGGLIWLEILNRHPNWLERVDKVVLIASPVHGSDLGRIIDPLALGMGIAKDLRVDRLELAEAVAAAVPVLSIAGDVDCGSDGTITVESTWIEGAAQLSVPHVNHPALLKNTRVAAIVREFFAGVQPIPTDAQVLIRRLRQVAGITDAHRRDFCRAKVALMFKDGYTIRTWQNPFAVEHIFVANNEGHCLYGGFVGWKHASGLRAALAELKRTYAHDLL